MEKDSQKRLIVNATSMEHRSVLLENGEIIDYEVEYLQHRSHVGDIYRGVVTNVVPSMEAAFIDIGMEKMAFLHIDDVIVKHADLLELKSGKKVSKPRRGRNADRINDILREGDQIIVQVAKDAISTKGPRLTCYVAIPGKYMVFMPTISQVGVSKKIDDDNERYRLRNILKELKPGAGGFIVRTAASEVPLLDLKFEADYLMKQWGLFFQRSKIGKGPLLLHSEYDLPRRLVRDSFGNEDYEVIIDDPVTFERCKNFVKDLMPKDLDKIKLYDGREPIMDGYGIENELSRALEREIDLPSGGSIVIEQTEALIAIDINTGKNVSGTNLEDTITQTNLEAVDTIIQQLKLRNLGGLIVIDFIDMERYDNREKVYQKLLRKVRKDKARTRLTKISEFGLVEMTRQRTRESLGRSLYEPCPVCHGTGKLKSPQVITYELFREIERESLLVKQKVVEIHAARLLVDYIKFYESRSLKLFEEKVGKSLVFVADASKLPENYRFRFMDKKAG